MSKHILEDNLRPESDFSPHDFRLSFHELSAFEEALFVGFRDEPLLPSRRDAPENGTGHTQISVNTQSPWPAAWQAAILGIVAAVGLGLILLLPSSVPDIVDSEDGGYSLAIDLDMGPAADARHEWADVRSLFR